MTTAGTEDPLHAAAARAFRTAFAAVLKIAPDEGQNLWIDGRQSPPSISIAAPDADAACVISGAREALLRVISGARPLESAYVAGRVAIAGDMSVIARLQLEGGR